MPGGTYTSGIFAPKISDLFANIVCRFVNLEERMADIFALLLGTPDTTNARFVFRTLKSPRARIDVLETLLEKSPKNAKADTFFDEVIAEFEEINSQRNKLVHGAWTTHDSGKTFVAEFLEEYGLLRAREITDKELEALLNRIGMLSSLIMKFMIETEQAAQAQPSEHPQQHP